MSFKITIVKGNKKIECPRDELVNVDETHDGVSFAFKDGTELKFYDQEMPIHVKSRMRTANVSFANANLRFDLGNYTNPVSVEAE